MLFPLIFRLTSLLKALTPAVWPRITSYNVCYTKLLRTPFEQGYDGDRARQLALNLQQRLRQLPGVESVSASTTPILAGWGDMGQYTAQGHGHAGRAGAQPEKDPERAGSPFGRLARHRDIPGVGLV